MVPGANDDEDLGKDNPVGQYLRSARMEPHRPDRDLWNHQLEAEVTEEESTQVP